MWTRIKYHLREYFSVKTINNVTVFSWYHKEFFNVVEQLYVENLAYNSADEFLVNMIDVFDETWNKKPKCFKRSKDILEESGSTLKEEDEAFRFTSPQPYVFHTSRGEIENERKVKKIIEYISKIAYQPLQAELMIKRVLLNVDFILSRNLRDLNFITFSKTTGPVDGDDMQKLYLEKIKNESKYTFLNRFLALVYSVNTYELHFYKESRLLQLSSYLLWFYGVSMEITEFIDACDRESRKHCSLIVPYKNQVISPDKTVYVKSYSNNYVTCGTVFSTSGILYSITCGENIQICSSYLQDAYEFELEYFDEIELNYSNKKDPFNKIEVYVRTKFEDLTNFNEGNRKLNGGCILSSKHAFCSIDFSGNTFLLQQYQNEIVADCELMDIEFYLVRLQGSKCCEIRLNKSTKITEVFQELAFECTIKCMAFKSSWKALENVAYLDSDRTFHLVVCLGNGEVYRFLRNDDSRKFFPIEKLEFNCSVVQCRFNSQVNELEKMKNYGVLLTVHEDNTCRLIYNDRMQTIKEVDKDIKKSQRIKILNFENFLAVISCEDKLYVIDADPKNFNNEKKCRKTLEINGNYSGVKIAMTEKNIVVCAYNQRTIDIYYIKRFKNEDNSYKLVHLIRSYKPNNILLVYEMKNSFILLKNGLFLVLTKTGHVYQLHVPLTIFMQNSFNQNFPRTGYQIDKLVSLNKDLVCSFSCANNELSIWNVSNGKKFIDIKSDHDRIKDVIVCEDIFFVVSIEETDEDKEYLIIVIYSNEDYSLIDTFCLDNHKNCVLLAKSDENKLIVSNYVETKIVVETISFNKSSNESGSETISLDLLEIFKENYSDLNSYSITYLNGYLVVIMNKTVYYIHPENKKILFTSKLSEASSNFLVIFSIIGYDDVMIVDNGYGIVYCKVDEVINTYNRIEVELFAKQILQIKSEKIEIKRRHDKILLCLLDESEKNLFLINLSLSRLLYQIVIVNQIEFDTDSSKYISLSDDLNYLAVCDTYALSLYRLDDNQNIKQIAHVALFDQVTSLISSDCFVSLSTKDRRVVSYLIAEQEEHNQRIRHLESREKRKLDVSDIYYILTEEYGTVIFCMYGDIDLDNIESGKKTDFISNIESVIKKLSIVRNKIQNKEEMRYVNVHTKFFDSAIERYKQCLTKLSAFSIVEDIELDQIDISKFKDVYEALPSMDMFENGTLIGQFLKTTKKDIERNIKKKIEHKNFLNLEMIEETKKRDAIHIIQKIKDEKKNESLPSYELSEIVYYAYLDIVPYETLKSLAQSESTGVVLEFKLIEFQYSIEKRLWKTFEDLLSNERLVNEFFDTFMIEPDTKVLVESYLNKTFSKRRQINNQEDNSSSFLNVLMNLKIDNDRSNVSLDDFANLFSPGNLKEIIPEIKTTFKMPTYGLETFKISSRYLLHPLIITNLQREVVNRSKFVIYENIVDEKTKQNNWYVLYLNEWMIENYYFDKENKENIDNYGVILESGSSISPPVDSLFDKFDTFKIENASEHTIINFLKIFSEVKLDTMIKKGIIEKLLNYKDAFNASIIHIAAAFGRNDIIIWLYLKNVDVKCVDLAGNTALYYAMLNGQTETIILLKLLDLDYLFVNKCDFLIKHIEIYQQYKNSGRFRVNVLIQQFLHGIEYMRNALAIYENNCDEMIRAASIIKGYFDLFNQSQ